MKTRLLATFTLLWSMVSGWCANPSLENFDQLYFKTNAPAPGIIQTRMNTNQFRSPVLPGDTWTITNVTGLTGASHWTNVAGVLQPVDGTSILVTNLVATSNTVQVGTVTWLTKSSLLSLGTNVLGSGVNSMFVLLSPTNDATQVILSLKHGYQPGQKLRIVNYTNNPSYSGAFTLPAGSAVNDLPGGFVRLPEDWVGTNGFVLDLEWQSPDWLYAGGWTQDGSPVFQTNYVNNFFVTNITVRGRITINNINVTTNDLWKTNFTGTSTNLLPVDPSLYVLAPNGYLAGANTAVAVNNALASTRDSNLGELDANGISIISRNSLANTEAAFSIGGAVLGGYSEALYSKDTTTRWEIGRSVDSTVGADLYIGTNGIGGLVKYIDLSPNAADGTAIVKLGTAATHTTGNLFEFSNNVTNRVSSDWMGRLAISQGDSSSAPTMIPGLQWRGDNGAIIGGSGLMRDQTGAFGVIEGSKEILHDTLGALFVSTNTLFGWSVDPGFYTANVTMGLTNVTGTGGSTYTGDIVFTKPGSYLARINYNSGYDGTGNLFLSSDGTYKTAGGGGSTLWTDVGGGNLQLVDGGSNTVSIVNTTLTNAHVYIFNHGNGPTNFVNSPTPFVIGLGFDVFNDASFNTVANIIGIGDAPYWNTDLQTASRLIGIGDNISTFSVIKSSFDLIGIGDAIMDQASLDHVNRAFGMGRNSGLSATWTNLNDSIFIGTYAFAQSVAQQSADVIALGDGPLNNSILTNSTDVIAIGDGVLNSAHLTNSSDVVAIGLGAGANLSGTFSHVVMLAGNNVVTNSNDFLVGDANHNYLFPGASLKAASVITGQAGFASTATETGAISSTGWTNSLAKDADVAFDATTLVYKLADASGAFWYTNTVAVGQGFIHLQPGGKFVLVSGSGLTGRYHAH